MLCNSQNLKFSQGGALLTALFIMTLVAIVATAMSMRLQIDIYRTQLMLNNDKLHVAAEAVRFWAMNELNKPKLIKFNKEGAHFPKNLESIYNQVKLSGSLHDLQSKFNLNNLTDKKYTINFINLMNHVSLELNPDEKNNIAKATIDWIMPYDLARGKDEYISYYLAQHPPYYPSHQLMSSISEFRLIKGVNAPIYLALESFITALPETTAININTASKEVLSSLGNGLSDAKVNELLHVRGEQNNINRINELLKKLDIATDQVTVSSQYFLSKAHASLGDSKLDVYTFLKRTVDKKGIVSVSVLRESIG